MAAIAAIIAFALFLLAAFGVDVESFNIVWMGLAFLALAFILGNLPISLRRNP